MTMDRVFPTIAFRPFLGKYSQGREVELLLAKDVSRCVDALTRGKLQKPYSARVGNHIVSSVALTRVIGQSPSFALVWLHYPSDYSYTVGSFSLCYWDSCNQTKIFREDSGSLTRVSNYWAFCNVMPAMSKVSLEAVKVRFPTDFLSLLYRTF